MKKILVPYDFSISAERALGWAHELVQELGGGSIRLLYVLSSLPAVGAIVALPISVPCEEDLETAEEQLRNDAARLAPEATFEAVLDFDIGSRVIDYANTYGADLIAMGTHGRSGIRRLVLGSVADYIVRHARCPVVVLREPAI